MSGYLLDTNVISETVRPRPNPQVLAWMAARRSPELFLSTVTIGEITKGVHLLADGARKRELTAWLKASDGLGRLFAGRIMDFTAEAATIWGRLMAEGTAMGRSRSGYDMMIAATAEARGLTVATLNAKDFWGIEIVNPLAGP